MGQSCAFSCAGTPFVHLVQKSNLGDAMVIASLQKNTYIDASACIEELCAMTENTNSNDLLALTTEIVAAHVSNNTVAVSDLPQLINQVYQSLSSIGKNPATTTE